MLYEVHIQTVIDYKARIERVKVNKPVARNIRLTREQYTILADKYTTLLILTFP